MRKLSLILLAVLAVSLAACKQKVENPSIADTSARQMQPADQAVTDQTQAQAQQDQSAAAQDGTQSSDQSMNGQAPADQNIPATSDGSDNSAAATAPTAAAPQVDETQPAQAQIPGLPDSAVTAPTGNGTTANPANPS